MDKLINKILDRFDEHGQSWYLLNNDKDEIIKFLISCIKEVYKEGIREAIEYISFNQGWEETGDKYRKHFKIPIKYTIAKQDKVDYSKPVEPIIFGDNIIIGYKNVTEKHNKGGQHIS